MYCTDEEELARETDWILKKNKRSNKKKAQSSPEISSYEHGTSTSTTKTANIIKKSNTPLKQHTLLPLLSLE